MLVLGKFKTSVEKKAKNKQRKYFYIYYMKDAQRSGGIFNDRRPHGPLV
jgi:coproporphyrinogen III oxidase